MEPHQNKRRTPEKGVNKVIINELLSGLDDSIWKEQIFGLVQKIRLNSGELIQTNAKRKYDYLARKGYNSTLIWSEMNNLLLLLKTNKIAPRKSS